MLNHEVFLRDPIDPRFRKLPNDGVAVANEPTDGEQWDVLRYELQNFICDGQYQKGLTHILKSFLDTQSSGSVQSAVWISGFYGSGKSHLARVFKFLWANAPLPDGSLPRELTTLTPDVKDLLTELSTRAKSNGGLWSAVGTMSSGAANSPRLAFLGVILSAAKLPTDYALAQFRLWLRAENLEDAVRAHLESNGETLEKVGPFFRMSKALNQAILAARPELENVGKVAELLQGQFKARADISDDELVQTIDTVLRGATGNGKLPLALVIVDELQQYLGEDADRTLTVQHIIEACSRRFKGQLMIVATGQSAMGASGQLGKLQGRFALRVQLSDSDALRVVREVVLRKKEEAKPHLQTEFEAVAGEISKHLIGSKISHRKDEDMPNLVADYPILPTRRRFWEEALRALDRQGGAAQLRSQLRAVHDANQVVALRNIGVVVGADALYNQLRGDLLQNGALQQETDALIGGYENKGTARDGMLARVLKITFLINQLSADLGVVATPAVIADLLCENLREAATLRADMDGLIQSLIDVGQLLEVAGEFRVQTRESAGWNQDFNAARARFNSDSGEINSARAAELNAALNRQLKSGGALQILHGQAKEKRDISLHFAASMPTPPAGSTWTQIPVWVRDGWNTSAKDFAAEATAASLDSPLLHLFLPNQDSDEIRAAIAAQLAADEVLQKRGTPNSPEGAEARAAMQSRLEKARQTLDDLIARVVKNADIRLSGGTLPNAGATLRATLLNAADTALIRLYPQWQAVDSDRWGQTLAKVRDGNARAWAEVGYHGDIDKHPVAAQVLSWVGAAKKGLDVLKHFRAAPFGWTQDMVYAALLGLLDSQHLSATQGGSPRTMAEIQLAQIGQTEFRRENITLTLTQKSAIKKLLQELGLPTGGDNLPAQCEAVAPLLRHVAGQSSGDAPAPLMPALLELATLDGNAGNALALEIYNGRDDLLEKWKERKAKAALLEQRLPRWNEWMQLLDLAPALETLDAPRATRDAMKLNRSLLDEPDPVTPAWNDTLAALRAAIEDAYQTFCDAQKSEIARLEANGLWMQLDQSTREGLLAKHGLAKVEAPPLGNAAQIAAALRACSLPAWATRVAALGAGTDAALGAAAQRLAPKSVRVALPSAHIESSAQIDEFLGQVRAQIEAELAKGNSVLV